jgi:hypothetical protein
MEVARGRVRRGGWRRARRRADEHKEVCHDATGSVLRERGVAWTRRRRPRSRVLVDPPAVLCMPADVRAGAGCVFSSFCNLALDATRDMESAYRPTATRAGNARNAKYRGMPVPGAPRESVSRTLRGRSSAESPRVGEPIVDQVETRCVHTALYKDNCGVRDAIRRERSAPMINYERRPGQRRLGRAERKRLVRGERDARGRNDAGEQWMSFCMEPEQMGGMGIEEDVPRMRLEERLDGTRYVRIVALGIVRACVLSEAATSKRHAVLIQKHAPHLEAAGREGWASSGRGAPAHDAGRRAEPEMRASSRMQASPVASVHGKSTFR